MLCMHVASIVVNEVKAESENVQTSVKHGLKAVCAFIAMINTTAKQTIEFIIVLPTLITDVAHLSKFSQSFPISGICIFCVS